MSFSYKKSLGCFAIAGAVAALVACGGSGETQGETLKPSQQLVMNNLNLGANNGSMKLSVKYKGNGLGYFELGPFTLASGKDNTPALATVNYTRTSTGAFFQGSCTFYTNTTVEPGPVNVEWFATASWTAEITYTDENENTNSVNNIVSQGTANVTTSITSGARSILNDVTNAVTTDCQTVLYANSGNN